MINKIQVSEAFKREIQPDGTSVKTIDAYEGCQIKCPYCFQMNNKEWTKRINIRENILDILKKKIDKTSNERVYLGALSDPYMDIEKDYQLTRGILEILKDTNYQVMITTKATNGLILRDLDLLKSFLVKPVVMIGLSDILEAGKGKDIYNINVINELHANGITVCAFITPMLPYVMDVDSMINAIDKNIPVYIDKLRVFQKGNQDKKMYEWIKRTYPMYAEQYHKILFEGDEHYYEDIVNQYKNNTRITFMAQLWGEKI